ncbi:ESPR-type extended signal peptide-containing protein, partial [Burkholderia cepacia]|uniref:ESPR-type extended signal peptide-containing protein n=1 Tax=Burkholderia cepacia TaxID=292 RepID=UPI0025B6C554
MNRLYKTVWNEESGSWVAVSELTRAHGKVSKAGRNSTSRGETRRALKPIVVGVAAMLVTGLVTDSAWAGSIQNCIGSDGNNGTAVPILGQALGSYASYQSGSWSGSNTPLCNTLSSNGVIFSENPGGGIGTQSSAFISIGSDLLSKSGGITMYGPSGIVMNGLNVSAANAAGTSLIGNVTAGVAPTDAVNVSQLNALNNIVTQNTANIAQNTADIAALQKGAAGGGSATGNNSTSVGGNSTASGNNSTGTGQASNAAGDNGTATGQASNAAGNNGTATGQASNAAG